MAKFVSLFVVPAVCACTPVLIPFGDAYAHSNDFGRNLRENWSYFFWYDSVGWSFLWLTMTVWTSLLLPELKLGALPIVVPTIFAVVIFAGLAYFVFPIPLGTFSIGVPCFGVYFICLFLGSDAEKRWARVEGTGTFLDKLPASKLLLVCVFFTVWVTAMLAFVLLTALMQRLGDFGQLIVMLSFPAIRDVLSQPSLNPLLRYMVVINPGTGKFFTAWFELTYNTYLLFLFPLTNTWLLFVFVLVSDFLYEFSLLDVSHFNETSNGWVAVARSTPGIQTCYFFFLIMRGLTKRGGSATVAEVAGSEGNEKSTQKKVLHIEWLVVHHFSEVLAFFPFMAVFVYNIYGPNFGQMYIFDQFEPDSDEILTMIGKMCLAFLVKTVSSLFLRKLHNKLLRAESDSRVQSEANRVFVQIVNDFYFPMILAIASITTVAGCCCTMKHDGMDLTLKFEWLENGGANMTSTVGF